MERQRDAEGELMKRLDEHEQRLRDREERLTADLQATRGALQLIEILRQEADDE
jgi:hypothetical protein